MSEQQTPATHSDAVAPHDRSIRDVGGISLAAALGGTLLSVSGKHILTRR